MSSVSSGQGSIGKVVVFRLPPGEDLLKSLVKQATDHGIHAGVILSGAASLRCVTLRNVRSFPEHFPITDQNRCYTKMEGPLELLSLTGNISTMPDGSVWVHAHVTVSSHGGGMGCPEGSAFGGHLVDGAVVFSTAEIVVAEITGLEMKRTLDPETKTYELSLV